MFSKSFLTAAAACSMLFSSVNAHMMIVSPVPYGVDSLNNSPLEPDGSDFPCKQRSGVYDISQVNEMPIGVPQKLEFKGGATHGGGSCQLSVTLDKNPTKESQWKVIYSIIGGCPNSAAGNADGSPNYEQNPTFEFSMPKGMPNGEYTMAWTWFNKIGNREMYMNCAPIKVTGGADNNEVYNSLPDMFVANIGNGCGTAEGQDFVFPQCGQYVETAMRTALGSSTSGTCAAPTGGSSSGSGSGGSSPAEPTGYSSPANSPAAPTYGSGASSTALAAPSYGGGSGTGASPAPSAPSYGGASPAAPQAPAPTGYGGGAASSVEGGAAAGGIATTYEVHTATEIRTITADGPAPTGYGSPTGPGGASGGSPTNYGGSNKGKVSSGSGSPDSGSTPEAPAGNSTSSGTCSGSSTPCSKQDEVICLDSGKWGLCDNGCVFPMALTQGTSCQGGVISKRHSLAAHIRRHLKHHAHKL